MTKKLSDSLCALQEQLTELYRAKRDEVHAAHKRVNPFYEDLFDWKERGEFCFGKNNNVTLYNSATVIGDVKVGKNTWIGPFTLLDGSGGLRIGENCSISTGAQLLTHDTIKWAVSGGTEAYEHSPTSIGDSCFIGTHAVITRGCTIGNHCVVAAGAVVANDVADNSIVGGIPAKVIGRVIINEGNVSLEYFSGRSTP